MLLTVIADQIPLLGLVLTPLFGLIMVLLLGLVSLPILVLLLLLALHWWRQRSAS